MDDIDRVRDYWARQVIGIEVSDKEIGSDEFFKELDNYYKEKYQDERNYIPFERYKGKKLLEIGCGVGYDLIYFVSRGAQCTGIDLSPSAIELAKKYLAFKGLKADVHVGNAEALDYPDLAFDVVVSLGVLHHTPNTQKAIDEVCRVLKPGGEAFIMLYNKYSWFHFLAKLSNTKYEHEQEDAPIIKTYSTKEVRKMFSDFGTVNISTIRQPNLTDKRHGFFAFLFNQIFVPLYNFLPNRLTRNFGWHILITAKKKE